MTLRYRLGVVLVIAVIGICVLLGSLGWFAVGFGIMTDCTNNYSCTSTGCAPCDAANRWITVGGVGQWVLAGVGAAVLVAGTRSRRGSHLLVGGVAVLLVSTLTVVGTTWRAESSFCRPGTPGYAASDCSTPG